MPIFNYLAVFRRIHKKRVHLAVIILMPISRGWAQNPSIKTINAEGGCNPNDIVWLHHYPQLYRQYGRAKRVYLRLLEISNQ